MADTAARFHALAEDAVEDLLRLDPEWATDLGDHRFDDQLTDMSEDGLAGAAATLADHRDELDSLDAAELEPADAVDAQILRSGLDRRLFGLQQLREHTWNPLPWLPGEAIYLLLSRDTGPVEDRLRALGGRLEAVPERLATARATLRDMPRVHVETALTQISGLISMLREQIPPLAGTAPRTFLSVEPMRTAAEDALVEHRDWLLEQLDGAHGDPRLGPSLFAAKLHLFLDADLPADQVVAAAREHLDRVSDELTELAVGWVGPGDDAVRRALDRAAAEAPDDRTIVSVARRWLTEATELVTSSGVVRVPDDPMEIEAMPELRRGVAVAYCDAPGPLEEGGVTRFAISPTPAGWSPERVASFYREYNTAMMANLTVHEAMPGHMVQLAHARRYRGATKVRQVLASGSFIEGWGVHAEEIMARLGYGGVPVRLQQLKTRLRTTINALLDAGVHAGGMTEAEAIDLMTVRGFQEEGEAVGKWRRVLLTSAQLSTYFVGYLELVPTLAGRTRYDDVLAHGSPPPRHLPTLLAAADAGAGNRD
ncbi:MAG TPA: DUF885 domain-containing protein [Mycobacteriales bacterium]|jgi:uncharacterized protein (DUF885 family)|nr:DUF885 domain-containing protein [Mycobacteriales bacterium]